MSRFFTSVISIASLALALSAATGASHANAQAPAPTPAAATSAKPDFNGTWKINLTKSQFSPAPVPSSETTILTLAGDDLTIAFDSTDENGKQHFTHALKIGGPEVTFTPTGTTPLQILSSKAEWKDNTIMVTDKISYQGGGGWLVSVYTLSPDGKTLTKAFTATLDMGTFDMTAVYDKA